MTIYTGAVAPEAVKATVKRGTLTIDLTTATAATFEVSRADGTPASWAATISNASATQLDLTHTFQSGDLTVQGDYYLVAKLTVPGGFIRAYRFTLRVEDPFWR